MTTSGSDWSDTLSYTYDCKGNIETISENGEQKAKYYYDELNQLIREDNAWLGKTIAYTYDNGGNILSVNEYSITSASDISALVASSTDTYSYGDSNWKDKLTSFNGNTITYDEIGNPLTYYNGYTFDWQNGRQLAGISATDLDVSYTYDANGIRTSKTVNGITTTYTLEGSNIVKETNGTDTLWYYYDAAGYLTSFELNGTPYFYVSNVQGDILAITDVDGEVVVEYTYDSWGKLISTTGSLADTVGIKNPFRYRGYYYDTEIGLYYLQSRYYDSCTRRFLNADGYASTGIELISTNTYAYCSNNPINKTDRFGQSPSELYDGETLYNSMDEAALAAAYYLSTFAFGSISDFKGNFYAEHFEYSVSIYTYEKNGKIQYYYKEESVRTSYRYDYVDYAGDYAHGVVHTHPFTALNKDNYVICDEFSRSDKEQMGTTVYVYSATGKLLKYDKANKRSITLADDLPKHWNFVITSGLIKNRITVLS